MFEALPVPPFVGRSRELDVFRQALTSAREDRGRAVWLRGATGIGKSRLAGTARAEAESAGMTVAAAQGYRIDRSVPYALWANAFQPLTLELDTDSLEALTRGRARELRWVLPVGDGPSDAAPPDAAPGELTTRIHWSFLELLRGLAQRAPLFIVLDDLHWADRSSLDLLHFVSRHLAEVGCVLTCATTPIGPPATRTSSAWRVSFFACPTVRCLSRLPSTRTSASPSSSRSFRSPPTPWGSSPLDC